MTYIFQCEGQIILIQNIRITEKIIHLIKKFITKMLILMLYNYLITFVKYTALVSSVQTIQSRFFKRFIDIVIRNF